MGKKVLLLIMLSFSLGMGGFWALQAQDPQNVRQDPPTVGANQTTQTDLSGTYTGTFNCEPLGLMGETTLTITGNEFTTADGKTGRIVASTTGGYTAVVLQVGGTAAAPGTPAIAPMIVSMRGRKAGNRLILTPVGGTTMRCSFTPGRASARGRRNQPATPAATGTEVANPATPTESPIPTESPSPMPEQTPSPMPSPTVSPTPTPEPTPEPSPEPVPSPTPGESPTPMPSPGEPMPSPSPESSPSPSPTPSPSPRQ